MNYMYKRNKYLGALYIEYNRDNSSIWSAELENGELFLYCGRVRAILSSSNSLLREHGKNKESNDKAYASGNEPERDRNRFRVIEGYRNVS